MINKGNLKKNRRDQRNWPGYKRSKKLLKSKRDQSLNKRWPKRNTKPNYKNNNNKMNNRKRRKNKRLNQ